MKAYASYRPACFHCRLTKTTAKSAPRRGAILAATLALPLLSTMALSSMLARPATALEAYSATAFRHSIGVNGVLSHTADPGRYNAVKTALREMGVLYIRGKITPFNAPRVRDLWDSSGIRTLARVDERVGDRSDAKLEMSRIPSGVAAALGAGAQSIVSFEGPNEWTHYNTHEGWSTELREYTQRLYNEVRNVRGLSHPIVGPTIYKRNPEEVRKLGNIGAWVDASNFHIYTSSEMPSYRMDEWFSLSQQMAPGEPVWVTEYGYHNTLAVRSGNPVSELTAARYLTRFAALAFRKSPRGKFFVYEFINSGTSATNREHNLGILRYDLSRKPAFHTYRRMIDVLESASAVQPISLDVRLSGETTGVQQVLLQKAPGQYLLMLWQEVPSWDRKARREINVPDRSVTVTLPRNASFIRHDTLPFPGEPGRDAAPVQLPSGRSSATIDVPDHIVILEMRLS